MARPNHTSVSIEKNLSCTDNTFNDPEVAEHLSSKINIWQSATKTPFENMIWKNHRFSSEIFGKIIFLTIRWRQIKIEGIHQTWYSWTGQGWFTDSWNEPHLSFSMNKIDLKWSWLRSAICRLGIILIYLKLISRFSVWRFFQKSSCQSNQMFSRIKDENKIWNTTWLFKYRSVGHQNRVQLSGLHSVRN